MVKMENTSVLAIVNKSTLYTLTALQVNKLNFPGLVVQFLVLLPSGTIPMIPLSFVLSWIRILTAIVARKEFPWSPVSVQWLQAGTTTTRTLHPTSTPADRMQSSSRIS